MPAKIINNTTANNSYNKTKKDNSKGIFKPSFLSWFEYFVRDDVFIPTSFNVFGVFCNYEIHISNSNIIG